MRNAGLAADTPQRQPAQQQQHAQAEVAATAPAASAAAAAPAGSSGAAAAAVQRHGRKPAAPALTLPELRSKAAFRACDRLMEQGAASAAQLWAVARVMSGEEFEQAAEERALAGKCGNPLCSQAPTGNEQQQGRGGGGSYHISTNQQAVYEREDQQVVYCSLECAMAVKQFGLRLGSNALALERFTAMYQQVKQQRQQSPQQQREPAMGSVQPALPAVLSTSSGSPATGAAGDSSRANTDSDPGGIKSRNVLVPRLAVEQVEVKHIDSSASQFADFSRKDAPVVPARPHVSSSSSTAAKPKGVLKKQSKFAAGNPKIPIMLAEVQERDPSMVAAETARSLTAGGTLAGASSRGKGAAAVEGYVPRAINSQGNLKRAVAKQRQRRVRFSDEVEEEEEAHEQAAESQQAAEGQRAADEPQQEHQAASLQQRQEQPNEEQVAEQSGRQQPGEQQQTAEQQMLQQFHEEPDWTSIGTPAGISGGTSGSMPPYTGAQEGGAGLGSSSSTGHAYTQGHQSLTAQFGSLYVADSRDLTHAARAAAAASSSNDGTDKLPVAVSVTPSSSISIQPPSSSSSINELTMLREWHDAPQFYAHSPVGSTNSLAGSYTSPAGSSGNLAAFAASSSPPRGGPRTSRPLMSSPPGLPRAPSSLRAASSSSSSSSRVAQPHQQDAEHRLVQPAQQRGQQEQQMLTKRQVEQLQGAFPPLSAALPPELEAVLSSDTDAESEAGESEDWMRSDDDEDAGASSGDEGLEPGSRSSFRMQLSFFGTLFTHLEAWVTPATAELLAANPDSQLALAPPSSPEVLATLSRFIAGALPPVLVELQAVAPRGEVERCLNDMLRTLRLLGPLPAFKMGQWQVVVILFLKALSMERCPALREAFETREGIGRLSRLLASLSFTTDEFYAALDPLLGN